MAKITDKEKAQILDGLMAMGIITNETLTKGIVGKQEEKKPRNLGVFKDSKGNSIEVTTWIDKKGEEYIAQTKVLPTGVRTKGFAIGIAEFKKYVAVLNSIVDKLGK